MLYFVQGICLAETGKPLFADDIEAWSYGSVIRNVYEEFCEFIRKPLELDISDEEKKIIIDKIVHDSKIRKILDFVYENYAVSPAIFHIVLCHF